MPPTGRSIDLDRIREKLEKAKSVEERKLLQEVLLHYVGFLRERYRDSRSEARSYIYALIIIVPLGFIQLAVSLSGLHLLAYTQLLRVLYLAYIVISICVFVQVLLKYWEMICLKKEIYYLYNTVLDPAMPRTFEWTILIVAAALVAVIITISIIGLLTT